MASSDTDNLDAKAIKRELARHDFFEKNFSKNPDTQTSTIHLPRKLVLAFQAFISVVISLIITYIISCIFHYIPYTQSRFSNMNKIYSLAKTGKKLLYECSQIKDFFIKQTNTTINSPQPFKQSVPQYDFDGFVNNWEKKLREQESFFTLVNTAIFSFLTPITYAAIHAFWEKPQSLKYDLMLERYIAEWPDFKICTPLIFWERFDIFFLGFLGNNKKSPFSKEDAEAIVKTMLLESLNKKFEYKN